MKTPKLFGKTLTSPGPFYAGGALHYVNKKGKVVHDKHIRTKTELKKLVMTQHEFDKQFKIDKLNLKKPKILLDKTEKAEELSLGQDNEGYYVYTHRSRSKSYKKVKDIPKSIIERISRTG